MKKLKNLKIKVFNINRLIALLISGIIIFCIKYYLNYFGYVTDISLIFIFFCAFLKSITLVTVEFIREPDLNKDGKSSGEIFNNKNELGKKLKDLDLYTKLSYNNCNKYSNVNKYFNPNVNINKDENKNANGNENVSGKDNGNNYDNYIYNYGYILSKNVENYLSDIEDIHVPISSGRLNYAISLDQVDQFFINLALKEESRHKNRLRKLEQEVFLIKRSQQSLHNEDVIFRERMNIIEKDRRIHIEYLKINGLKYTSRDEDKNNDYYANCSDDKKLLKK